VTIADLCFTICLLSFTGANPTEDHWAVRRQAAALLAAICAQFAAPHHNLVPRLCRVLVQAFLDPGKHLSSKYGAVVGLQVGGYSRFCVGAFLQQQQQQQCLEWIWTGWHCERAAGLVVSLLLEVQLVVCCLQVLST
jgi:hypothetical protein